MSTSPLAGAWQTGMSAPPKAGCACRGVPGVPSSCRVGVSQRTPIFFRLRFLVAREGEDAGDAVGRLVAGSGAGAFEYEHHLDGEGEGVELLGRVPEVLPDEAVEVAEEEGADAAADDLLLWERLGHREREVVDGAAHEAH